MYGVAVYYVLGVLYFAIAGRHRLVLSPEEEFALTQGERGVPGQEGYVTSAAEQEAILGGGSAGAARPAAADRRWLGWRDRRRTLHHPADGLRTA